MIRNIFFVVLLQIIVGSSYAYEVEQEGDRWYVYRGNELIGTYSHMSWPTSQYSYGCGDPSKGFYETKYADVRGTYTEFYKTKRAAKNAIIKFCKIL